MFLPRLTLKNASVLAGQQLGYLSHENDSDTINPAPLTHCKDLSFLTRAGGFGGVKKHVLQYDVLYFYLWVCLKMGMRIKLQFKDVYKAGNDEYQTLEPPKDWNHSCDSGNHPQMAELFKLVTYYNLYIHIYIYSL